MMVSPEGFKFATLRHADRVHRCAAWLLGDAEEARDVTQEAFMRLWEHRDRVAPEAARTWLLRTTHRLCVDRVRRLARHGQSLSRRERAKEPVGGEQIAIRGDERDALARAVGLLPFRDRAVILLREVQGLSYAELCEVLDLPVGTVKACLHRARRRLRAAMPSENESDRSSDSLEKEVPA